MPKCGTWFVLSLLKFFFAIQQNHRGTSYNRKFDMKTMIFQKNVLTKKDE
jgi:hypothetical protein